MNVLVDILSVFGFPITTAIRMNAEKFKLSTKSATPIFLFRVNRSRSCVMENVENLLEMWLDDPYSRHVPVNLTVIQPKRKSLFRRQENQRRRTFKESIIHCKPRVV